MPFVSVEVTGASEQVERLNGMTPKLEGRLRENGERFGQLQVGYIRAKMEAGNPLHIIFGNLSNSLHSDVQRIPGVAVIVRVYSNGTVPYARIHEFGGDVNVPAHTRMVKPRGEEYAGERKMGLRFEVPVRAYTAHYPQRSYLRSALAERRQAFIDTVKQSAVEASR